MIGSEAHLSNTSIHLILWTNSLFGQQESFDGKNRIGDSIGMDGLDMVLEGIPIFSACGRHNIDGHFVVDSDSHRIIRFKNIPFVFKFLCCLVRESGKGKNPFFLILQYRVDKNIDIVRLAIEPVGKNGIPSDQHIFHTRLIQQPADVDNILPGSRSCVIFILVSHIDSTLNPSR